MAKRKAMKPDPLTNPVGYYSTPGAKATHNARHEFDKAMSEAEGNWGTDRLEKLCTSTTAAKWGKNMERLDKASDDNDAGGVSALVGNMIKGIGVMHKEALDAGYTPVPDNIWMASDDAGVAYAFVNDHDAARYVSTHPEFEGVAVYSLQEVMRIIKSWQGKDLVDAIKDTFPGAQVASVEKTERYNDDLPF